MVISPNFPIFVYLIRRTSAAENDKSDSIQQDAIDAPTEIITVEPDRKCSEKSREGSPDEHDLDQPGEIDGTPADENESTEASTHGSRKSRKKSKRPSRSRSRHSVKVLQPSLLIDDAAIILDDTQDLGAANKARDISCKLPSLNAITKELFRPTNTIPHNNYFYRLTNEFDFHLIYY